MDIIINVGLITLVFGGALLAFAGDTVDDRVEGKSIPARITRIGWISIVLLTCAFALGVAKEIRDRRASERAEARTAAAEKQTALIRQQLADANARLGDVDTKLLASVSRLAVVQERLNVAERSIVTAVGAAAEGIPRVYDDGFVNLDGRYRSEPVSVRNSRELRLFGGDDFEYHCYCQESDFEEPTAILGLYLEVDRRRYPLEGRTGVWRIAGPVGVAMPAQIVNSTRSRCRSSGQSDPRYAHARNRLAMRRHYARHIDNSNAALFAEAVGGPFDELGADAPRALPRRTAARRSGRMHAGPRHRNRTRAVGA